MKIHENLLSVSLGFDVFLFDAYGVFWNGKTFCPGSREVMETLMKEGKKVFILSNSTQLGADAMASYAKKGLLRGYHYTDFISSGDAAAQYLKEGRLSFASNPNPLTYYRFGSVGTKIFDETKYMEVKFPSEADFFYISVPQLTTRQRNDMSHLENVLFLSDSSKEDFPLYDSLSVDPFIPQLKELLSFHLPAFNANPDITAASMPKSDPSASPLFAVRQGAIARQYKQMGGEVFEIGKPYPYIYEFAFSKLERMGVRVVKDKVLMVGDTVRTDIRGANLAGIKSVLCVEGGVAGNEVCESGQVDEKKLTSLFQREEGMPDFLIKSVG